MITTTTKKCIFFLAAFLLCGFVFAQNIKVTGTIPNTDTGKMYQLQIGAYSLAANADKAAGMLTKIGFVPRLEKVNNLTRVFIVVKAAEVKSAVDRLCRAGFKEVIIREYPEKKPVAVVPAEIIPEIKVPYKDDDFKIEVPEYETKYEPPEIYTEEPENDLMHLIVN